MGRPFPWLTVLASAVVIAATTFALHLWAPGVWDEMTADASIANAIVSIVGALLGTLIAVAAAYAILTRQVSADRQLELDMRLADVAHEVAGEISFWRDSLSEPGRGGNSGRGDPTLVRALVQRRDRLEPAGVPVLKILNFVRMVERDRRSLDASYTSIVERIPVGPGQQSDLFSMAATMLQTGLAISAEWSDSVVPHVDSLDAFATRLSGWHPGSDVPALNVPEERSLVCTTVELERRLGADGWDIPRDPIAERLGLYQDANADEADEETGTGGEASGSLRPRTPTTFAVGGDGCDAEKRARSSGES